jgi:hypothetical protein
MKAKTILAFVFFFTLRAAAQDVPKPQTQAQCRFSDGKTITVTYSSERRNYRLVTDENLVTVRGITVPAGDYTVVLAWNREDQWNLIMRTQTEKGQTRDLPRLPMSTTTSTLPVGNSRISFDQTDGSCMMHLGSEKANTLLSLEFTEKNTDLPVLK